MNKDSSLRNVQQCIQIKFKLNTYRTVLLIKCFSSIYHMEGNFEGCKLWQNGKENITGGINFGRLMTKV